MGDRDGGEDGCVGGAVEMIYLVGYELYVTAARWLDKKEPLEFHEKSFNRTGMPAPKFR